MFYNPESGNNLSKFKSSFTDGEIERLCSETTDDNSKVDPHSIYVETLNVSLLSHKF